MQELQHMGSIKDLRPKIHKVQTLTTKDCKGLHRSYVLRYIRLRSFVVDVCIKRKKPSVGRVSDIQSKLLLPRISLPGRKIFLLVLRLEVSGLIFLEQNPS